MIPLAEILAASSSSDALGVEAGVTTLLGVRMVDMLGDSTSDTTTVDDLRVDTDGVASDEIGVRDASSVSTVDGVLTLDGGVVTLLTVSGGGVAVDGVVGGNGGNVDGFSEGQDRTEVDAVSVLGGGVGVFSLSTDSTAVETLEGVETLDTSLGVDTLDSSLGVDTFDSTDSDSTVDGLVGIVEAVIALDSIEVGSDDSVDTVLVDGAYLGEEGAKDSISEDE